MYKIVETINQQLTTRKIELDRRKNRFIVAFEITLRAFGHY